MIIMIKKIKNKGRLLVIIVLVSLLFIPTSSYAYKKNKEFSYGTLSKFEGKRNLRELDDIEDKKIVMFTFDDGPSEEFTNILIDELKKRDAKVTFFMMGNKIERYPDIVKKAYKNGHSISNHSYSHKDLRKLKNSTILYEINKTNELLEQLGIENKYFRPPYGFSNNKVFNASEMSFIFWSVDPMDWKYKNAERIYKKIIDEVEDGSVVIAHDIYKTSIEGVLMAIDKLLEEDYVLISLEEAEDLGYLNSDEKKEYHKLK